ncbi:MULTISPECIES: hypothetical protein [Amycolatopsis]|uniref:hypothetical protein n=1 Tax=Amycolatopsis TaxID=1813 RepID=UPI0018E3CA3B|nr:MULTISPECIES: hypothetical protein [Amycolatopsis]
MPAYASERLAAGKRPRLVRFPVDLLPATSTGKIMRRELVKQFTPQDGHDERDRIVAEAPEPSSDHLVTLLDRNAEAMANLTSADRSFRSPGSAIMPTAPSADARFPEQITRPPSARPTAGIEDDRGPHGRRTIREEAGPPQPESPLAAGTTRP